MGFGEGAKNEPVDRSAGLKAGATEARRIELRGVENSESVGWR